MPVNISITIKAFIVSKIACPNYASLPLYNILHPIYIYIHYCLFNIFF